MASSHVFGSILINSVKKSELYAISFDESLNSVIQMGQIDLVVKFWDNIVNKVCTLNLGSTFVDHARHKDLSYRFISAVDFLDQSNLLYQWMVLM